MKYLKTIHIFFKRGALKILKYALNPLFREMNIQSNKIAELSNQQSSNIAELNNQLSQLNSQIHSMQKTIVEEDELSNALLIQNELLIEKNNKLETILEIGKDKFQIKEIARIKILEKECKDVSNKIELLGEIWLNNPQLSNSLSQQQVYKTKAKRRSIAFIHHCYYNFYYLAIELRKRGWDAISVNIESPDAPNQKFFHGEDLSLYDPDPLIFRHNLNLFYETVKNRFKMIHFYGGGSSSIFPEKFSRRIEVVPWDFLEFKLRGIKIGYSVSGCNDLTSQTSFYKWSNGKCDQCIWKNNEKICSDSINLQWGKKIHNICDLICIETDAQLDYKIGDNVFPDPLTFALDANLWKPDLEVPAKYLIPRENDEIIIYHGVGNYETRTKESINFKGTHAVFNAINRLKEEGHKVRLEFVKDVPSKDVRYIQVQADIIVEQLNYGRYGATARETMMLGKPTITYINKYEVNGDLSPCILETPIISANEETIYEVLLDLINSPEKRKKIGEQSREHAVKWWSAEKCAERFEWVYDRMMAGQLPNKIAHELRSIY